jgi:ribosomal protein S18 acetylase RimI-like enzyme
MEIQRLTVEEVARFRAIRLCALRDAPSAFGTTFEEAAMWPPEVWSKLLSGLVAFVAVMGDSDVGLVRGAPDARAENAARLGSLWVAPEARGAGVGASLVDAVVEWAHSKGFVELLLGVSDDNVSAIALYTRKGFEPSGEVGTLPPPREHLSRHERILKL